MTRESLLVILIFIIASIDHCPWIMIKAGVVYPILHYMLWLTMICVVIHNAYKAEMHRNWLKKTCRKHNIQKNFNKGRE